MNKLKIVGFVVAIAGFLVDGLSGYVEDKKMETMVEEEVRKQLTESNTKES